MSHRPDHGAGDRVYNPGMHPPRPRLKLLLRALVICWLLCETAIWFGIRYLGYRLTGRSLADRQALFGQSVLSLFRRLGATFIKVGQIMSTRPDLLPPHVIAALSRLQDDVGPFPYPHVERTIAEDFGQPIASLYREFSPVPIASASVAQVHRARLPNGQIVAVKVRRPDIEELCSFDLSVMSFYARVLELIPSLRLLAPLESVQQFGRAIAMQLDFTIEAQNNARFTKNFALLPEVIVPTLHPGLCSRRVLTMDFIEGQKILDCKGTQPERRALGELGFRVMLKMIFADGFVHADLHPGNLLVTPGDRDGFEQAIQGFVDRLHGKRLGEVEVAKVVYEMLQILRRYRVRVNATFTMVNIAIAVTEGIGKQLDPSLDLMNEAMPFFLALSL